MADMRTTEGAGLDIDFTLVAGPNFRGLAEGTIITRAMLTRTWLYIRRKQDDAVIITKSDRDDELVLTPDEIEWTDPDGGECTAKIIEADTTGKPGKDANFELWGDLASNGEPVLLDKGTIDIDDSIRV